MQDQQEQPPLTPPAVVAMLPSPGMGHLIPMLELAKRLIHRHLHKLAVTIIIPTNDNCSTASQTTVLRSLPDSISHTFLPSVSLSDLPPDSSLEILIGLTVLRSLPSLRHTLHRLLVRRRIAALVIDPFCLDAIDVAAELSVPSYVYFPSSASPLSFTFIFPRLDQTVQCDFRELTEPVQIPGCVPLPGKDVMDPVQDRQSEAYKYVLRVANRIRLARGIIQNSFFGLEPGALKELKKSEPGRPPVYPVGPLVNMDNGRTGVSNVTDDQCLRWLDEQPHGSVLFVCFGSGGTLSSAQINELALGLEMSEQRFLWVVRCPNERVASGSYFNAIDCHNADPFDFLPEGFVERTRGVGFVVPFWAPQARVLAHGSTGGFLTHCGWNSILESVVNGVPLIAWPLYAEQKMNAVFVTEDAKVALRPEVGENGLAEREEIASVVKRLMQGEEGKKLRYRMKDLKEAAAEAVGENGSSTKQIDELALMWMGQTTM